MKDRFLNLKLEYSSLVDKMIKEQPKKIKEEKNYEIEHYIEYDKESKVVIPVPIIVSAKEFDGNYDEFKKQAKEYIKPTEVISNLNIDVSGSDDLKPSISGNNDYKVSYVTLKIKTEDYGELLDAKVKLEDLKTEYFNVKLIEIEEKGKQKTVILEFTENEKVPNKKEIDRVVENIVVTIISRVKKTFPSHYITFPDFKEYESKIKVSSNPQPSSIPEASNNAFANELLKDEKTSSLQNEKVEEESPLEDENIKENSEESYDIDYGLSRRDEAFKYLEEKGRKALITGDIFRYILNNRYYPVNKEELSEEEITILINTKDDE